MEPWEYQRLQWNAQQQINRAVKRGDVVKPDKCSRCGSGKRLHAHHADYEKPLEVEWLCAKCHGRKHTVGELAPKYQPKLIDGCFVEVTAWKCTCARCGYSWLRKENVPPPRCAGCKTTSWNREKIKRGRPRLITPATPKEYIQHEEVIVDLQPKTRRSAAKAKPKREEKKATGKAEKCPHGFFVIDGLTACRECKKSGA